MAKALDQPSLYDTDYVAWLGEQVAHLRAGRLRALDVENVAEELEEPDEEANGNSWRTGSWS